MHGPTSSQLSAMVSGGIFVSDLHLFSPRSAAALMAEQLSQLQSHEHCIVLGGDIFDFRWSVEGNLRETIRAAINWLENLLASSGQAHVRFLPGNHDCHPDFLQQLTDLAQRDQRFGWFEYQMQIGDCLFLHGDILDARGSLANYRKKFIHEKPQPEIVQKLYNAAVGMRIHKLIPMVRHPTGLTCQRIKSLVVNDPKCVPVPNEIARVFFGHTHVPVLGHEQQHVRFFNPGAALKHMQFHPQRFAFDVLTPLGDRYGKIGA